MISTIMPLISRPETSKLHLPPHRAVCCLSYVLGYCCVLKLCGRERWLVTVVKTDCQQSDWLTDQPVPPNTVHIYKRNILSVLEEMCRMLWNPKVRDSCPLIRWCQVRWVVFDVSMFVLRSSSVSGNQELSFWTGCLLNVSGSNYNKS